MIYDGALAADGIFSTGRWVWCLVIGILIIVWILIGITNLGKVNTVAMAALFIMTLILCGKIFTGSSPLSTFNDSMNLGAAVELSVAMPLSWLPSSADYTRVAEKACCSYSRNFCCLLHCQLLDVYHRHGCSYLRWRI